MSFFNSKPWAKIPTDLLENKAMIQAEKELGEELRASPVLLYLAGATKADEDGIFDLGDGEEFAALIKTKSPEIVFQVASVMTKYRILAHVPKSSVYLFAEWEYSTRQNGKSLKNRFAVAGELWKKKQEEDSYFCPQYTKIDTLRRNLDDTSVECLNTIQDHVNECFNTIQGEKNATPQIRREQIREEEIRTENIRPDEEQTTHTRVDGVEGEEGQKPSEPFVSSTGFCQKKSENEQQNPEEQERLMTVPNWSIVPESSDSETFNSDEQVSEKEDAIFVPEASQKNEGEAENNCDELVEVLTNFFRKNNAVYNEQRGIKAVRAIANELIASTKTSEQAIELARKMCKEFKQMHDMPKGDRWHNIPLFPNYMIKEAVWAQLITRVSSIYGTLNATEANLEQRIQKEYAEVLEERKDPSNTMDSEYIRYGISPSDPNRVMKLLQIKNAKGV